MTLKPVPIWKANLCSAFCAAFCVTLVQGKAADHHDVLARMIGKVEVSSDWFRCFLVVFSTFRRCAQKPSPPSLVSVYLFAEFACYVIHNISIGACKTVNGSFILCALWMKGHDKFKTCPADQITKISLSLFLSRSVLV